MLLAYFFHAYSLMFDIFPLFNQPVTQSDIGYTPRSNLISPGRMQRTYYTSMQAAWATQSQFTATK